MSDHTVTPGSAVIGFIGLGIMGRPMAANLIGAGYRLIVHDRAAVPVEALVALGAKRETSPASVAIQSDVVITMLPDTPDLEAVVGGVDGLGAAARPGSLVIDMSTVDPLATREIAQVFTSRGVGFVDAPVSGGEPGAIAGSLSIMVGGSEADVARAMPLLEVMGRTIVRIGEVGAGQIAKAANQLVVGVTIEAVAEALALAEAAGVSAVKVREALSGGFAASRVLEFHGQRMIDRDFKPGFRAQLHLKDARIIARTAESLHVPTPALQVALQGFERLEGMSHGNLDHSALFLLVSEDRDVMASNPDRG